MSLVWVSADARTGEVLADLPGVVPDWPLRRTIGQYDTATVRFYLDGAPPNWERALLEGGAVLACYDDDDPARIPQWAGLVVAQTRDTSADAVGVNLATGEAYFDRRYVGDETFSGVGQNLIVAALIDGYVVDGVEPGIPIALDFADAGTPRDRTYYDADAATVYTRLTQLMGVAGGPEFTVDWSWAAGGELLVPTLRVAGRIGTPKPADHDPAAVFDMPGCVSQVVQVRDYTSGKGANKVTAYGSGQGDATPTSGPVYADDFAGRPTLEFRWNPSDSATDPVTLRAYARAGLSMLAPGARAVTLVADRASAPRLGVDWQLGDDVKYEVGGLDDAGRDTVPMFPGGITGYPRAIAYELNETTIAPIAAEVTLTT